MHRLRQTQQPATLPRAGQHQGVQRQAVLRSLEALAAQLQGQGQACEGMQGGPSTADPVHASRVHLASTPVDGLTLGKLELLLQDYCLLVQDQATVVLADGGAGGWGSSGTPSCAQLAAQLAGVAGRFAHLGVDALRVGDVELLQREYAQLAQGRV